MGSDLWSRRAGGVGGDCYTDDLVEVGSQHHPSGLRDGDVAVVVDVRQAHPVVVSYRNARSSDERLGSSRGNREGRVGHDIADDVGQVHCRRQRSVQAGGRTEHVYTGDAVVRRGVPSPLVSDLPQGGVDFVGCPKECRVNPALANEHGLQIGRDTAPGLLQTGQGWSGTKMALLEVSQAPPGSDRADDVGRRGDLPLDLHDPQHVCSGRRPGQSAVGLYVPACQRPLEPSRFDRAPMFAGERLRPPAAHIGAGDPLHRADALPGGLGSGEGITPVKALALIERAPQLLHVPVQ